MLVKQKEYIGRNRAQWNNENRKAINHEKKPYVLGSAKSQYWDPTSMSKDDYYSLEMNLHERKENNQ